MPRPGPPIKRKTDVLAARKHLVESEVRQLCTAARKAGRHGHRDATMILLAFRHGLRCAEAVGLRWEAVFLAEAVISIRRVKHGNPSTHPLTKAEVAALKKLPGAKERKGFVFRNERGGALGVQSFYLIVARAGAEAGLDFPTHPHMLRHACGYYLAAKGIDTRAIQVYLGHRNIAHTAKYTAMAPGRFDGFFED